LILTASYCEELFIATIKKKLLTTVRNAILYFSDDEDDDEHDRHIMDVLRTIYDSEFLEFQVAVKIISSKAKFLTSNIINKTNNNFKIDGKKFNCVIAA
jgi:hypothetical protein